MLAQKLMWLPPMKHILDLEQRFGINGREQPLVFEGDMNIIEHTIHEIAHASLLDIVIDDQLLDLSHAVASELGERAMAQKNPKVPSLYEIETLAAESLIAERLGLPISLPELFDALAIQVAHDFDDYIPRMVDARDTARVAEAVDHVCEIIAPSGAPALPPEREGIVFHRLDKEGREITVYPMAFGNARLCLSEPGDVCYLDAWCYQSDKLGSGMAKAMIGATQWDGDGDDPPGGWYRNPKTGRRRPDGDPNKEHVHW